METPSRSDRTSQLFKSPEESRLLHAALLRVAQRALGNVVARRVDPEDVLQSAYRTLLRRLTDQELSFEQIENLQRLLTVIVRRKAMNTLSEHFAQLRSIVRESDLAVDHMVTEFSLERDADELMEYLLHRLSADDAQIALMLAEGLSIMEIMSRIDFSRRGLFRAIERIRKRFRDLLDADRESV